MQTDRKPKEELNVSLKWLILDTFWKNIVGQIGNVEIEQGKTLDEQIADNERRTRFLKEIEKVEKLARNEKQPKKKFELVQIINGLKGKLK